jgi:putative ABC transport system permease protein
VRADIRLGLRLAGGGASLDRARAVTVVLAGAAGSWVLLTTLAIASSKAGRSDGMYTGESLHFLLLAVVATVTMPVVVLVATTARLSASVRDRRLACLRLLGLSPARTRLVAAVESGAVAAVGSLLGLGLFWLLRPVVSRVSVAGIHWSGSSFAPSFPEAVLVVVAVPLVAVVVALLPTARLGWGQRAYPTGKGEARRPSPLRLVPLAAGLILTQAASSGQGQTHVSDSRIYGFMAGAAFCGLGLLIVVPVFTRLLADLMVRLPGRPSLRIAGRRLQAQPASVSRIVAGLLLGLFLVTGGRMVVGAFEDTPQYRSAERAVTDGPAGYEVGAPKRSDLAELVATLSTTRGVRGAYLDRRVLIGCQLSRPCPFIGFVGTCHDLEAAVPGAVGCRDDAVAWLDRLPDDAGGLGARAQLTNVDRQRGPSVSVSTPKPDAVIKSRSDSSGDALQAEMFIPTSTPGVLALSEHRGASTQVSVQADPGSAVASRIMEAVGEFSPKAYVYPTFDRHDYDFVAQLRAIVWGVAAVVLAVGLLGFAIATVDRAVSRRAEMVSLQLIGTSRNVIRRAQWWESSLPLLLGLPLAIAVGWSAGSCYLALGGALDTRPWQSVLTLAATSVAASIGIAGLSVVACAPRIRADLIRRS